MSGFTNSFPDYVISVSKPGQLQIILVDGAERLDKESRDRLYAKCKDSDALEVTEL